MPEPEEYQDRIERLARELTETMMLENARAVLAVARDELELELDPGTLYVASMMMMLMQYGLSPETWMREERREIVEMVYRMRQEVL